MTLPSVANRCSLCCSTAARYGTDRCTRCALHPAPHDPRGRFNARCALCWTEMGEALPRSIFLCIWRLVRTLRQLNLGMLS
jgi:hypothetical protein